MSDGKFIYSTINFNDPIPSANRPATLLGWVISFMIISWICVGLRLYVRFKIVRAPGWDDLFVALYLLTMTVGCVSVCVATNYGLGKHILQLPAASVEGFLKSFYVQNASYASSTCFVKLALLLQYLRMFQRGSKLWMATWALLVITALWGFAYSFLAWVPCVPVSTYWDIMAPGNNCYGYGSHYSTIFVATYESHTALNMVLDAVILIVPLPLLFRDSATVGARCRLAALLMMGCIVLALAAWRLQTMIESQVATYPTRDPTWYGPISILLAALEINAASICASVPIFWPVFASSWGGIFVTQEVKITSESRYVDEDGDSLTRGSVHSRHGSDSQFSIVESGESGKKDGSNKHYRDSFVLRQVDPLRLKDDRDQPSAVGRETPIDDTRKWMKF